MKGNYLSALITIISASLLILWSLLFVQLVIVSNEKNDIQNNDEDNSAVKPEIVSIAIDPEQPGLNEDITVTAWIRNSTRVELPINSSSNKKTL